MMQMCHWRWGEERRRGGAGGIGKDLAKRFFSLAIIRTHGVEYCYRTVWYLFVHTQSVFFLSIFLFLFRFIRIYPFDCEAACSIQG